jgi:hypothetical protein
MMPPRSATKLTQDFYDKKKVVQQRLLNHFCTSGFAVNNHTRSLDALSDAVSNFLCISLTVNWLSEAAMVFIIC